MTFNDSALALNLKLKYGVINTAFFLHCKKKAVL